MEAKVESDKPTSIASNPSSPDSVPPVETKPQGPPPPPDGGLKAWLQVLGAFFFVFNTWGLANAFGVFQTYYTTELLKTSDPSTISWVGSIQGFLLLFVGVLAGRAFDAGYFFYLAIGGTFLEVFGMMMTSLSTEFYQVFLAQGLCVGIGSGFLFTPAISLVGTYFAKKRALATGIAASGSSLGGIIYPIVIKTLLPQVGFGWAVRTMGFLMLGTLAFGISLLRPRLPPRKSGPIIDLAAFKDAPYVSFVIGLMFAFLAFFIPFFYSEFYGLNIGTDADLSFYVLAIMNAAGLIGRLVPNAAADYFGNLNLIIPCAITSAIAAFAWIAASTTSGLIAVSVFYSFLSGGLMALPPAVIVFLSPSLAQIGTRVGMALTIGSLGVLTGSPIAGAILKSQSVLDANGQPAIGQSNFSGVLAFTGAALVISAICMTYTRYLKKGFAAVKV